MKDYIFFIQALHIVSGAVVKCVQCVVFQNQKNKKRIFLTREDLLQFLRLREKEGEGAVYLNARRKKRKALLAGETDTVEIRLDGELICVATTGELKHVINILREKPIVIMEEQVV